MTHEKIYEHSIVLKRENQSYRMSGWIEPFLRTYEVPYTTKNRRTFRQVARDTCGESMEPTEGDVIIFGEISGVKVPVVCVVCGTNASDTEDRNEKNFYHWINFLFVIGEYQGRGYGSLLIQEMESLLRRGKHRPIQIESASKAVQFFKKQGYTEVGEPMECIHSGSPLFRFLQKMEKFG